MNTDNDVVRKVHALQELAQEVQPARDLWSDIAAGLSEVQSPQPLRKVYRTWVPAAALAACVALVAIGVWIGGQMNSRPQQVAAADRAGAVIHAALMDPAYQRQRDELLQALPAKLAQLPPESRQHVGESLRAIDEAMQAIESELGRDAGNALLQQLLISTRQEQIRVLTAVRDAGAVGRI